MKQCWTNVMKSKQGHFSQEAESSVYQKTIELFILIVAFPSCLQCKREFWRSNAQF